LKFALLIFLVVFSVAAFLTLRPKSSSAQTLAGSLASTFVFVKIPEEILPLDRGEKYEDPLDASLKKAKLGEVTGGGTQLGKEKPNGKKSIEWVGVDVELSDFEHGLPFLKSELKRLGAPIGTTLEFTRDGKTVSEAL
jgi:hypothetical protein